jgi:hypothetical protein
MAGFNLFERFLRFRSRADVKSKVRGNGVRNHVLSNPYHAVSIASPPKSCAAALEFKGKRFLSTEAPKLPLKGCMAATCTCRYAHHDDRRAGPRRSSDTVRTQNQFFRGDERRRAGGRRINDH